MSSVFWNPYTKSHLLSCGRDGVIHVVSKSIVVKLPYRYERGPQGKVQRSTEESMKSWEHEKGMYVFLDRNPHPSILQSFLTTPYGIFLPRMKQDLASRLEEAETRPRDVEQCRWILQISSAAAWLERLSYFHGDLRPRNILLDSRGDAVICDFGNITERGQELPGATYPFYRRLPKEAGPMSEQFAVGSCIFNIRTGHKPLHHLQDEEAEMALDGNEFPSTDEDCLFGPTILRCWEGAYETLEQLHVDIGRISLAKRGENNAKILDEEIYNLRVSECEDFENAYRRPDCEQPLF